VYKHFYSFSLSLVERIAAWMQDIKVSDLIIKNRDVYQEIITNLKEKKGCFFVCSHLGNIDLLRAFAIQKLPISTIILSLRIIPKCDIIKEELEIGNYFHDIFKKIH